MKFKLIIVTTCVYIISTTPVLSHHSRANFVFDTTTTLVGKITKNRWRNPHVYLEIQTTNKNNEVETWLIEGGTPTALRRQGWSKDTVKVGDDVVITGNPDRNPEKNFLLIATLVREDGKMFSVENHSRPTPEGEKKPPAKKPKVTPSQDFSGTWGPKPGTINAVTGSYSMPPSDWPLTILGETIIAQYDDVENPAHSCIERGVPLFNTYPYLQLWTRNENRIDMIAQQSTLMRTFYLNIDEHPDDLEPSVMGHSIAHFENDGGLLVDTIGFSDNVKWGLAPGVDSSDQKHIIERYTLTEGSLSMDFSITLEDPINLTKPVTVTGKYNKVPEVPFEPYDCDPANASIHLSPPSNSP